MPSSPNTLKSLAKAVLFLAISAFLTLVGWYFSWSQVHSRDWKGTAAIVLLLPYLLVNRAIHWFSGAEPLSVPVYRLSFVLGSAGQLLYYFGIFALIRRLASVLRRPRAM